MGLQGMGTAAAIIVLTGNSATEIWGQEEVVVVAEGEVVAEARIAAS